MINSETYLRSDIGLIRVSQIRKQDNIIWTGSNWSEAKIIPTKSPAYAHITFSGGHSVKVAPSTSLLITGEDSYYRKKATELSSRDYVCMGLPDGYKLSNKTLQLKSPMYWFGFLFAKGIWTETKLKFSILMKDQKGRDLVDGLDYLKKHMSVKTIITSDRKANVAISGPKFDSLMGAIGAWWDEDGLYANVPPGCYVAPAIKRRTFAKGVIDAIGTISGRNWKVPLITQNRAEDFSQILISVGVPANTIDSTVYIPRWIASYNLNTSTQYPTSRELRGNHKATNEVVVEFTEKTNTRVPRGLASYLKNRLRNDPSIEVCPAAFRMAWRQMNGKPKTNIFDSAKVQTVEIVNEPSTMYKVKTRSIRNYYDANGFILSDLHTDY